MPVQLEYRVPPPELRHYITLFYHFCADLPRLDDTERADHAQLRFRLSAGAADYTFAGDMPQDAPPCHVIGPTASAFRTRADGPVEVIGMGLHPAGWAAIIGVDASTMVDRVLDGAHLFGAAVDGWRARMAAADGTDAKVAVAAALVRASLAQRPAGTLDFARRIDAWLADAGPPAVDALVAGSGLSRRQVERRTKALYGVPPKTLARKYRALRAAVALAEGATIDDALSAGGFYDQSHLIRELRAFTGLTPRRIRDAPGLLTQLTISHRRALHGQVPRIVSDT